MKHFASLNKTKAKGKHHFEDWEMGTGQYGASEQITDRKPQLWGLWRNLHLSPRPVLGPRAGHAPCPPKLSVSNSPKPGQEDGSTRSPHLCKLMPGSAAQRASFTFSAATNSSASVVSIPPWDVSGCSWELPPAQS